MNSIAYLTRDFWFASAERAVKTAAQSAILVIGADLVNFNATQADWGSVGGFALGGAVLSLLTSVASAATNGEPAAFGPEKIEGYEGDHRESVA